MSRYFTRHYSFLKTVQNFKKLDLKDKELPGLVDRQDESHEDHKKLGEVNQS
jgi:hypothetical protein